MASIKTGWAALGCMLCLTNSLWAHPEHYGAEAATSLLHYFFQPYHALPALLVLCVLAVGVLAFGWLRQPPRTRYKPSSVRR